jgi:hypothetical protein
VHHIKRWVDDEKSRYERDNGVTVCIICHYKHHGPHGDKFPWEITNKLTDYIKQINKQGV